MKIRLAALLAVSPLLSPAIFAADTSYRIARTIPAGGEGGWDYLNVDAAARRLYVSRGTRVAVLNADSGAAEGEIPSTEGVHGIALAPDLGRGFTSNGRAGTIAVGGKPEFAVTDLAGHVYVNIEDKNEIVALNPKTLQVEAHWPLAGCDSPTGLAIDVKTRRLFAGCGNQTLVVLSAADGRFVTKLAIGKGTDAVVFDPDTNLVFSSNGDGTLTIIREDSADAFHVVQNLATKEGARTMALDPKTHAIFLPAARWEPAPPATPESSRPRRKMVTGSFEIVVAAPAVK